MFDDFACVVKILSLYFFLCIIIQACLLPTPKGKSCGNYARCVNQILQNLNNMQVLVPTFSRQFSKKKKGIFILIVYCIPKLWLRIPLAKSDDDESVNGTSDGMVSDLYFLKEMFKICCYLWFVVIFFFRFVSLQVVEGSDSWELWNSFRVLCEHHCQLSIALDVL